ncbi:MAG: hypothetical protein JSV66_08370 [Trueperaceae bacterium]|nr:MAG: hypothetical protein JSV66_08370 [Trueperaceae bacterium]
MADLAIFTDRRTVRSADELTALIRFRKAAFDGGHKLDLLFYTELSYLSNYQGILIRTLTDPLNTAYVVAKWAEIYGIRVLDTPDSIRICCDKVNMYGRLMKARVPIPQTAFLGKEDLVPARAEALFDAWGFPLILKAPNSSFSAYVEKVATPHEFVSIGRRFFRRADRIVVQGFVKSSFDWRVITLGQDVLAVVKYVFAPDRWKTEQRSESGEWATVVAVAVEEADQGLLELARAAAAAMGNSLYGIDIKEVEGGYLVIEVNDNPTIAAGQEDRANPDIYERIVAYLASEVG